MGIFNVAGFAVGAVGSGVAIHQYLRNRQMRRQSENRRQELENFGKELNQIAKYLDLLYENFSDPLENEDHYTELTNLSKSILAYKFEEGEPPLIEVYAEFEDERIIDGTHAASLYRDGFSLTNPRMSVRGLNHDFEPRRIHSVSTVAALAGLIRSTIDRIQSDYPNLNSKFSGATIREVESKVSELIQNYFDHNLSLTGEIVEPSEFESFESLAQWIFEKYCIYDEIDSDINEFCSLADEIRDIKKTVFQTSLQQ